MGNNNTISAGKFSADVNPNEPLKQHESPRTAVLQSKVTPPAIPLRYPPGLARQESLTQSIRSVCGPGKNLTIVRKLNEGAQGTVFIVNNEKNIDFAAKTFKTHSNEVAIYEVLGNDHKGWAQSYGSHPLRITPGQPPVQALVTEFVEGPTLEDYVVILHGSNLPFKERRDIAQHLSIELRQALLHSAGRGIEHNDIKPWNLIVDRHSGRLVVLDLGSAIQHASKPRNADSRNPGSGLYPNDAKALMDICTLLFPEPETETISNSTISQDLGMHFSQSPTVFSNNFFAAPRSTNINLKFFDPNNIDQRSTVSKLLQLFIRS